MTVRRHLIGNMTTDSNRLLEKLLGRFPGSFLGSVVKQLDGHPGQWLDTGSTIPHGRVPVRFIDLPRCSRLATPLDP